MPVLNIILIIVSVALMTAILMQSRSAGMGAAFGGGGSEGFHVRRGSEKVLHQVTIILSVLFVTVAFAHLFV